MLWSPALWRGKQGISRGSAWRSCRFLSVRAHQRLGHRHGVVAQGIEMASHAARRRSLVHGEDRLQNLFVLADGERHQAGMERRLAPIGLEPVSQPQGLRRQIVVVARGVDALMEACIRGIERVRVLALRGLEAALVRGRELFAVLVGMAARRQSRAGGFEKRHGLEHLDQLGDVQLGHERAHVWPQLDVALRGELLERLAHRGARGAVARGERFLVELHSRDQPAGDDVMLDRLADAQHAGFLRR